MKGQFSFHNWSRSVTFVTLMAAIYPLSMSFLTSVFPALKTTTFAATWWGICFVAYFTVILHVFRFLRAKHGLLKGNAPRRKLSKREYLLWKATSMLAVVGRIAATFLGASDKATQPWLSPSMHDVPGLMDLVRMNLFIIAMDGLFYLVHRLEHSNRFIYKHVHSKHHELHLPTPIAAMHDTLFEKFINSFLQVYLTSLVVPLPFHHLHLSIYSIFFAELGGHSGVKLALTPPYTPILDLLDCAITIESHDLHHRITKSNFGKQTLLWDKLFGTYMAPLETGVEANTVEMAPKLFQRPVESVAPSSEVVA